MPYVIFAFVVISALCGLLFSKILASETAYRLFRKANINKSFYNSVWNDIADLEHGVWVRAYLPGEQVIYSGYLKDMRNHPLKKHCLSYQDILLIVITVRYWKKLKIILEIWLH